MGGIQTWIGAKLARSRTALPLAALACTACGASFYEPNPPQLKRFTTTYTAPSHAEPVVFFTILDLYLEDPAACAPAHDYALRTVRAAMGQGALELPVQDLSPACNQPPSRRVDLQAVSQAIGKAEAQYPNANVRAIAVYVNNLLTDPGFNLRRDLANLRTLRTLHPLLWTFAQPDLHTLADLSTPWTWAGDPNAALQFQTQAQGVVPLQTQPEGRSAPVPLVDAASGALLLKSCDTPASTVSPVNFTFDGLAQPVNLAAQPAMVVTYAARAAVRRAAFAPDQVSVSLEACLAHCDRYFDYQPGTHVVVWTKAAGCLLRAP